MKASLAALAVVAVTTTFSGLAAAQITPNPAKSYESPAVGAPPSEKSRAEVKAETKAAGVRGDASADDRRPTPSKSSNTTRAAVKADAKTSKTRTSEASSYDSPGKGTVSTTTRAAVKAKTHAEGTTGAAGADAPSNVK